jgi:hypothetical protein
MRHCPHAISLTGLILGFLALPATAGVVKCKAPDGAITYTQNACPAGTASVDLDERLSSGAAAAPSSSGTAKSLSAPAMVFKSQMERCIKNEADEACQTLDITAKLCRIKSEWSNPVCVAFREAAEASRDKVMLTDDTSMRALRNACARGHNGACTEVVCASNVFEEGDDDDVRACAHKRQYPFSSQWVQLSDHRSTDFQSFTFLCMQKLDRVNSFGVSRKYRPRVSVLAKVPAGGVSAQFRAANLPDESFGTAGQAAVAGCKAQVDAVEQKKELQKETARKNVATGV